MRILFHIAIEKCKSSIIRDTRYRKLRTMLKRMTCNIFCYSPREMMRNTRDNPNSLSSLESRSNDNNTHVNNSVEKFVRLFLTYDDLVIIRAATIKRVDTVCCTPSYRIISRGYKCDQTRSILTM